MIEFVKSFFGYYIIAVFASVIPLIIFIGVPFIFFLSKNKDRISDDTINILYYLIISISIILTNWYILRDINDIISISFEGLLAGVVTYTLSYGLITYLVKKVDHKIEGILLQYKDDKQITERKSIVSKKSITIISTILCMIANFIIFYDSTYY